MKVLRFLSPKSTEAVVPTASIKDKIKKSAAAADRAHQLKKNNEHPERRSQKKDRYLVEDVGHRSKSSSPSKRQTRSDENTLASALIPLIDRVPTAIGYHSDESEEEWLEEKSKCSRYDITQQLSDDAEEQREEKEERELILSDDEELDHDKYSQKKPSKKKAKAKTKKEQPDTISRLWSESTDSDNRKDPWSRHPDEAKRLTLDPADVSYLEEKGDDPIYDSSPKSQDDVEPPKEKFADRKKTYSKQRKEKKSAKREETNTPRSMASTGSKRREKLARSPFDEVSTGPSESGTPDSETSSLTDPLDNMLSHTATDQVVKEIEQKLKLLKQVAKKEKAENKKKNKRTSLGSAKKKHKKMKQRSSKNQEKESSSKKSQHAAPTIEKNQSMNTPRSSDIAPSKASKTTTKSARRSSFKSQVETSGKGDIEKQTTSAIENVTKSSSSQSSLQKTESKDAIIMSRSASKDVIELNRSVSVVESMKPTRVKQSGITKPSLSKFFTRTKLDKSKDEIPKSDTDLSADVGKAINTDPLADVGKAEKANKRWSSMYNKSLVSEDSEVDLTLKSTLTGGSGSLLTKESKESKEPSAPTTSSKQDIGMYMEAIMSEDSTAKERKGLRKTTSWFSRSKTSDEPHVFRQSSFWKKKKTKKASKQSSGGTPSSSKPRSKEEDERPLSPVIKLKSPKRAEATELDEYSYSVAVPDEAALVECLKFYACGAVADKVNVAIKIAECAECTDDVTYQKPTKFSTPKPTIEVMLEEPDYDTQSIHSIGQHSKAASRHAAGFPDDFSFSDDDLMEAPPLSRVPSVVIEVSDMQLHLDGYADAEREAAARRGKELAQSSDVSVTSIRFVKRPPPQQHQTTNANDDEREIDLDEYIMGTVTKKKGMRRLLSVFNKNKQ